MQPDYRHTTVRVTNPADVGWQIDVVLVGVIDAELIVGISGSTAHETSRDKQSLLQAPAPYSKPLQWRSKAAGTPVAFLKCVRLCSALGAWKV